MVGSSKSNKRHAIDDEPFTGVHAERHGKRIKHAPNAAPREPSTDPELSFIEPTKEERRIGKILLRVLPKLLDNQGDLEEFAEIASAYFSGRLSINRPSMASQSCTGSGLPDPDPGPEILFLAQPTMTMPTIPGYSTTRKSFSPSTERPLFSPRRSYESCNKRTTSPQGGNRRGLTHRSGCSSQSGGCWRGSGP